MSGPVEVLAVMRSLCIAVDDWSGLHEAAICAHEAVAELIEADDLYTKARELWDHGSLPFIVYKAACDRRDLALARGDLDEATKIMAPFARKRR